MIFEEGADLSEPFGVVLARVKGTLAASGFGVLFEIDLQATLREKVGKQMDRYVILGVCNPNLASRALDIEPAVGVLLPCNVVVREVDSRVRVEALDPNVLASFTREEIGPIIDEARRLLREVFGALAAPSA